MSICCSLASTLSVDRSGPGIHREAEVLVPEIVLHGQHDRLRLDDLRFGDELHPQQQSIREAAAQILAKGRGQRQVLQARPETGAIPERRELTGDGATDTERREQQQADEPLQLPPATATPLASR